MARPKGISRSRSRSGQARVGRRLGGARQEHFYLAAGNTLIALKLVERDRQKSRAQERERGREESWRVVDGKRRREWKWGTGLKSSSGRETSRVGDGISRIAFRLQKPQQQSRVPTTSTARVAPPPLFPSFATSSFFSFPLLFFLTNDPATILAL